ncbi:MAG TPA: thiamine pyrophosphate-binding protein, partial [Trebonia sp.]|nr:thiamine pyrophosphate-binding protein [Trebonia sp.]
MTEQTSPVPPKAHAPSPLDIPARTAAQQPQKSTPMPSAPAQPASSSLSAPQPSAPQQPAAPQPAAQPAAPARVTGAQALVLAMERVGVEVVFGIPGGAVLPAYDPLLDSKQIRHILVRHEQGAGHAAAGYAQATGRIGVCLATSGPGATNLVTPLADAYMDSVPVVAITGQVATSLIGTDGFQEADISGITYPITKHNFLVTKPEDIARTIGE